MQYICVNWKIFRTWYGTIYKSNSANIAIELFFLAQHQFEMCKNAKLVIIELYVSLQYNLSLGIGQLKS